MRCFVQSHMKEEEKTLFFQQDFFRGCNPQCHQMQQPVQCWSLSLVPNLMEIFRSILGFFLAYNHIYTFTKQKGHPEITSLTVRISPMNKCLEHLHVQTLLLLQLCKVSTFSL